MNFHGQDQSRAGFRAYSPSPKSTGKRRRRPALECLESRELLSGIVEYPVPSPGCLPTQITWGRTATSGSPRGSETTSGS